MTLITRCDACGKSIRPEEGEAVPRDRSAFVELQASDTPQQRRHYHRQPQGTATESCWDQVKAGLLAAEDAVRTPTS